MGYCIRGTKEMRGSSTNDDRVGVLVRPSSLISSEMKEIIFFSRWIHDQMPFEHVENAIGEVKIGKGGALQ